VGAKIFASVNYPAIITRRTRRRQVPNAQPDGIAWFGSIDCGYLFIADVLVAVCQDDFAAASGNVYLSIL
jgi:hypothetical protein